MVFAELRSWRNIPEWQAEHNLVESMPAGRSVYDVRGEKDGIHLIGVFGRETRRPMSLDEIVDAVRQLYGSVEKADAEPVLLEHPWAEEAYPTSRICQHKDMKLLDLD